jgi:hypothetical protein
MATKKKVATKKLAAAFVFKKDWVFDPVPPWLKLDKAALTRIKQLRTQFVKDVNKAIVKGQR